MSAGIINYNEGPCLEILGDGKYEAFISISEVCFAHRYEVRLRNNSGKFSQFDGTNFKLFDATVVEPASHANRHEDREVWSFSEGFQDERVIEVYGATLRNLRAAYQKNQSRLDVQIDPKQFYSTPSTGQYQQVVEREDLFRTFPRQELAFNFFDEIVNHGLSAGSAPLCLKVFSFESTRTGQRKFLVADYDSFFRRYTETNGLNSSCSKQTSNDYSSGQDFGGKEIVNKHVYEIIRDDVPCRAYFDLEYQKEFNRNINGDILTSMWINIVVWKIFDLFGVSIGKKDVIILDSSTAKKYSKHVILVIPFRATAGKRTFEDFDGVEPSSSRADDGEYLFRNNIAVGNLVRVIIAGISEHSKESHHAVDYEVRAGEFKTKHSISTDDQNSYRSGDSSSEGVCGRVMESNRLMSDAVDNVPNVNMNNSDHSIGARAHTDLDLLWVNKEKGEKTCFVDLGVYTKNRAFRLWNSSKFGKNVPFTVLLADKKIYQGLSYSTIAKEVEKLNALPNRTQSKRMNPIDQLRDFTLKRSFVVPYDVCGVTDYTAQSKGHNTGDEDSTLARTRTLTSHADVSKSAPNFPLPASPTFPGQPSLSDNREQGPDANPASASKQPCHQKNSPTRHDRYLHVPSSIQTNRHSYPASDMEYPMGAHRVRSKWSTNEIAHSTSYREISPFPLIDEFVSKFVCKGGVKGILGKDIAPQTEDQLLKVHYPGVTSGY